MNISYVWDRLKIFKNRDNKREWDKLLNEEGRKIVEQEINKVAPSWVEGPPLHLQQEYINDEIDSRFGMNDKFTMGKMESALTSSRSKSSPGRDGIEYEMLKRLPMAYKKELLYLLNEAFDHGALYSSWKEMQTVFIEKTKNKFRPITMSSCVEKIEERMINERLIWLAERERWMDPNQNGFRRGRSCIDNLAKLISEIEVAKSINKNVVVVLLDVKSAYDNVIRECCKISAK